MSEWLQDMRMACRALGEKPGFALLTIRMPALGSAASTLIFTVISGVLLKPLEYSEPENLVAPQVETKQYGASGGFSRLSRLRAECRSFKGVAAWTDRDGTVKQPGEPEYVAGQQISPQLFSVLRIHRRRCFL